jgi:2'-5' RNA ligase
MSAIAQSLSECVAPFPAFSFRLQPCGGFPNLSHPRVLWAGCESSDILRSLHRHVDVGLLRLGFDVEPNDLTPHITLARIKSTRKRIYGLERALAAVATNAEVLVRSIDLMVSDLSAPPGVDRYSVFASAPLSAAVSLAEFVVPAVPAELADAVLAVRAKQRAARAEARRARQIARGETPQDAGPDSASDGADGAAAAALL